MAGAGISAGGTDPWGRSYGQPGTVAGMLNPRQPPPAGYQYDPVSGTYNRSPQSAGSRAGQYVSSFNQAAGIPSIAGLMSGFTSGSSTSGGGIGGFGGGTGVSPVNGPGGSGGGTGGFGSGGSIATPSISAPNTEAATNAAYAQAKNQVGAQSRASIDALNGELGATGQMGSGAQVAGTRDIVENAAGQLGSEVNNEEQTNAQIGEQNQLAGYQGGIAQRGQDIGAQVATRGQDVQLQEANANLALQANNAAAQRNLQLLTLALGGLNSANNSGAGYGPIQAPTQAY